MTPELLKQENERLLVERNALDVQVAALEERIVEPIPMLLNCPGCGALHIDRPEPEKGWTNPPHKSHLCHACGVVWRPSDRATVGVAAIDTRGTADTWPALRCSACGSARIRQDDGSLGACSLIGCRTPLVDYLRERAARP